MAGSPLLVVSLPARGVSAVRDQTARAREGGADMVELRVDRWPAPERSRIPEVFPSPLPVMATFRSRIEGGEGPDAPADRRPVLGALARLPIHSLDMEEDRDLELLGELPAERNFLVVLSTHLPEDASVDQVRERLRRPLPARAIRKIVLPATVARLLGEILPAVASAGGESAVVLTTGPSGPLLRAWSRRQQYAFVFAAPPTEPGERLEERIEPSQIPVDRLRWYFGGDVVAPLFALFGRPVAHSQSPYLHGQWMRSHRHHGLYVPLEIRSETELVESLPPLIAGGLRGANVTHPWKGAALALATSVGRGAELCGVANCLTFRDDEVAAENTDLAAALRRLEEIKSGGRWSGTELLVLGSGGSAAATLAAARELGATAYVMARSPEKSESIAARFDAHAMSASAARPFDLVVHATDVGRAGAAPLELPLDRSVGPGSLVLDWVYSADDAFVREAAVRGGAEYEDGWRLLVYQAAASFGLWWGAEPSPEEIERTILEGPCAA